MSSTEREFSQLEGPCNDESTLPSPPQYSPEPPCPVMSTTLNPSVGTSIPPDMSPLAYNPAIDPAQPAASIKQPPIVYQPQMVYHPTNVAGAGPMPVIQQYPIQTQYAGPGSGQVIAAIYIQPVGVPLQPVQVIQRPSIAVPDEMCCSVIITLFCCWYLGIAAMILASQANSLKNVDPERALSKARTARGLNIASFTLGTVLIIVTIFQVTSGNYYY